MHKALEIGLSALAGAVIPAVGAIFIVGGQANRIEQLERRVAALEQRPTAAPTIVNPTQAQCAKLAAQYALPTTDHTTLKEAMDSLACFRSN